MRAQGKLAGRFPYRQAHTGASRLPGGLRPHEVADILSRKCISYIYPTKHWSFAWPTLNRLRRITSFYSWAKSFILYKVSTISWSLLCVSLSHHRKVEKSRSHHPKHRMLTVHPEMLPRDIYPSTHVHGKTCTQSSQRRLATAPKWKITPMATNKGTDQATLWRQWKRPTMLGSKSGVLIWEKEDTHEISESQKLSERRRTRSSVVCRIPCRWSPRRDKCYSRKSMRLPGAEMGWVTSGAQDTIGWWTQSASWFWWWLYGYTHWPKLTKRCTQNEYFCCI